MSGSLRVVVDHEKLTVHLRAQDWTLAGKVAAWARYNAPRHFKLESVRIASLSDTDGVSKGRRCGLTFRFVAVSQRQSWLTETDFGKESYRRYAERLLAMAQGRVPIPPSPSLASPNSTSESACGESTQ